MNQEVASDDTGAPIPHVPDDTTPDGGGETATDPAQAEAPPVTQGESMSQETTAAILEAQGSMHDDIDPDEKP